MKRPKAHEKSYGRYLRPMIIASAQDQFASGAGA